MQNELNHLFFKRKLKKAGRYETIEVHPYSLCFCIFSGVSRTVTMETWSAEKLSHKKEDIIQYAHFCLPYLSLPTYLLFFYYI